MGAFGIGMNIGEVDSGDIRGNMYHIACKTWFTSNGKPLPLSFKFEGDDGVIQSVSNIHIKSTEDKNYSGIPSKEYDCDAIIGGILQNFKIIYFIEACKWVMLI